MPEGTTADARLERLLHILPAASREEGATLAELAASLGTTERRIQQDLEQVTSRAYYHPGGWPDDVSILLEADRVRVFHAAGFERPARLTERETLCLALALRGGSAGRTPARRHRARRAAAPGRDAPGRGWVREDDAGEAGDRGRARARARLLREPGARRGRHPRDAPRRGPRPPSLRHRLRQVRRRRHGRPRHPPLRAHLRRRRLVRRRLVRGEGGDARVPPRPDPRGRRDRRHVRGPRRTSTRAPTSTPPASTARRHDVEVRVRYSPKIARWVRERAAAGRWDGRRSRRQRRHPPPRRRPPLGGGPRPDLRPEAEILEPEQLRAMVREVVERMGSA